MCGGFLWAVAGCRGWVTYYRKEMVHLTCTQSPLHALVHADTDALQGRSVSDLILQNLSLRLEACALK